MKVGLTILDNKMDRLHNEYPGANGRYPDIEAGNISFFRVMVNSRRQNVEYSRGSKSSPFFLPNITSPFPPGTINLLTEPSVLLVHSQLT